MITTGKIKKIRKQLSRGIPEGEIKNDLKNEGYTDEDIQLAFAPKSIDMRSWYLAFGLLFILFGFFIAKEHSLHCYLFGIGLLVKYYLDNQKMKNKFNKDWFKE